MKPGIFTRKKLREIIPGLTRAQENQVIELYLMAREESGESVSDEDGDDEDESPTHYWVQVRCQSKSGILIEIKGF